MNLRTGVDLVDISRLSAVAPAIRHRFLKRVFTDQELLASGNSDASLAGKFAAKEAVAKALGTGIGEVHWQDIEIQIDEVGAPGLVLHDAAKQLAEKCHLDIWSISISHSETHAVAVAVAVTNFDCLNSSSAPESL